MQKQSPSNAAIRQFCVVMGDKTQVATVALGARFHDVVSVTARTTLGMMVANVPAVFLGNELIKRLPLKDVRFVATLRFLAARADRRSDLTQ